MLTIAMLNQKGGVGKTTLTLDLGGALAEAGYRALLVDLDPQGHLTEAAGLPDADDANDTLARLLVDASAHNSTRAQGLAVNWVPGVDVVRTTVRMFLTERELYRERGAEYRLQRLAELWASSDRWDVCLIDCPPSLAILTDNALVAADQVIIPVEAEDSTMRALRLLLAQVDSVRSELRTDIDIVGLVVDGYDARKGIAVRSAYEALHELAYPVIATLPDRAAIREARREALPVVSYAPDSDAAEVYRGIVKILTGGEQ